MLEKAMHFLIGNTFIQDFYLRFNFAWLLIVAGDHNGWGICGIVQRSRQEIEVVQHVVL